MNILNKLTMKHMTMNKKRTIVTIIGVILSTALMVGIGLLFSTLRENSIDSSIRYSGNYHAEFMDVSSKKLGLIEKNGQVKKSFYTQELGYAKYEGLENDSKPYLKLVAASLSYFDELNLVKGRFPKNENEVVISNHIISNGGVTIEVGDEISLPFGVRTMDGELLNDGNYYDASEKLENTVMRKVKVVGIVNRSVYEAYSDPGYSIFTLSSDDSKHMNVYVRYKKVNKAYDTSSKIAQAIGFSEDEIAEKVRYNDSLLAMYGVSKYDNIISSIAGVMCIILALISIGCIIVIYNSFAISVMERKKQFGLFSSIGATRKQLRKTVFYEAVVVGSIGIPFGILSGFIGIGTVLAIINYLIPNYFDTALKLSVYPLFILIPIIFMIVVVLASAFIPAHRASKITPIEAIRQNDDIKMKGRKLKSNRMVKKVFGIEGELAYKNMKRNKKKYRITIASLFISIVLFVSFSSFIDYIIGGSNRYLNTPDYDISLQYDPDTSKKFIDEVIRHEQVDDFIVINSNYYDTTVDFTGHYSSEFDDVIEKSNGVVMTEGGAMVVAVNPEKYAQLLKALNETEHRPILVNRYLKIVYEEDSRKVYNVKRLKDNEIPVPLCRTYPVEGKTDEYGEPIYEKRCTMEIKDYYLYDGDMFGISSYADSIGPVFIISSEDIKQYQITEDYLRVFMQSDKYDKLDEVLTEYLDSNADDTFRYVNVAQSMKLERNFILVVKILVYGFIALVTLIGVTSVFNTINTSIALRRKEFAMLRSVGLTPKGFNKILYFESLFVGLKALLYALPVAVGVIILIHGSMSGLVNFEHIMIPYKSILLAIAGVFVIVILTMMYASKKIKKENILEAIREENI